MAIKILLILLLFNVVVSAESENSKRYYDYILSEMERRCKFLEKERGAKKHKVDVVPDSSSAVAIALDIAYSKFDATPAAKTGVRVRLIGEHKEYWYVRFFGLMKDYNKEVGFKALISRNNGTFLCGSLVREDGVQLP